MSLRPAPSTSTCSRRNRAGSRSSSPSSSGAEHPTPGRTPRRSAWQQACASSARRRSSGLRGICSAPGGKHDLDRRDRRQRPARMAGPRRRAAGRRPGRAAAGASGRSPSRRRSGGSRASSAIVLALRQVGALVLEPPRLDAGVVRARASRRGVRRRGRRVKELEARESVARAQRARAEGRVELPARDPAGPVCGSTDARRGRATALIKPRQRCGLDELGDPRHAIARRAARDRGRAARSHAGHRRRVVREHRGGSTGR